MKTLLFFLNHGGFLFANNWLADIYLWERVKKSLILWRFESSAHVTGFSVWLKKIKKTYFSSLDTKHERINGAQKKGWNRKVGAGRPRPIKTADTQQRQQHVTLISCKWGGILSRANDLSAPPVSVNANLPLNAHLRAWLRDGRGGEEQ